MVTKDYKRLKSWRMRNGIRHMSIYMPSDLFEEITKNAKGHQVSNNELVLTYIQWGTDVERNEK